MNKRGEKIPPLEDYKVDDKPLQTVDLFRRIMWIVLKEKVKTIATDRRSKLIITINRKTDRRNQIGSRASF
jgi:hypothetical protein